MGKRLYVGNLSYNVDSSELEQMFAQQDRKSTRLNSSHRCISYAVFCLKKKNAKDFKLDTRQTETAKELRDRVRSYLTALALDKQAHYSKVQAFNAVASHLEQLERQLRSSMPQHVIDMLGQNGLAMASR